MYGGSLLGFENNMFLVSASLLDDSSSNSVLSDSTEVCNEKGDTAFHVVFEGTNYPMFRWSCHELCIFLFIFNFLLKITHRPSTL